MTIQNFLNENSHRSFPFLQNFQEQSDGLIAQLPNSVIVDFGSIVHPGGHFAAGEHSVWLSEVERTASSFIFRFRSNAPGLDERTLTFTRDLNADDYQTEYVHDELSESGSLSLLDCLGRSDPVWSGYLVTKSMEELRSVLGTPSSFLLGEADEAVTEPALTRSLSGTGIRTITLLNTDRTRATSPEGCRPVTYDEEVFLVNAYWTQRSCITGPVVLKEGYNASVQLNSINNTIAIGAGIGLGAGQPCGEIELAENEVPPLGRTLLSGGPSCQEVIRSINGVSGPHIAFRGGPGVDVIADPAHNRVIIDVSLSDLAVCFDSDAVPTDSLSLITPPEDGPCGPL